MNFHKSDLILILYIVVPMIAVQAIYRIIDRRGVLTRHLQFLKKHKLLWQIALPIAFILIFGVIGFFIGLDKRIYFAVCGGFVGLTDGAAIGIMNDDKYESVLTENSDENEDEK